MSMWDDLTRGGPALGSSGVNIMNALGSLRSGGQYDPAWANWIGKTDQGDASPQYSARGDPRVDPNTGAITIDGQVYSQVGDLSPEGAGASRYHSLDPSLFQYDPSLGVLTQQSNINNPTTAIDNIMPYIVGGALGGPAIGAAMGAEGAVAAPAIDESAGLPMAPAAGAAPVAAAAPTVEIPGAISQIPDLANTLPEMVATPNIVDPALASIPGAVPPIADGTASLPEFADTPTIAAPDFAPPPGAPTAGPPTSGAAPFDFSTVPSDVLSPQLQDVSTISAPDFSVNEPEWYQKMLGKINPLSAAALGINLASAASQRHARSGVPQKLADVAKPFQEQGQALLDQYKSGKLNPADEFGINKWVSDQTARIRDFYGRAGMGDSSAALNAIAEVEAKGQSMRDTSLNSILEEGIRIMGMAVGPLTNAIQAEASNDASLAQATSSALNSFFMMQALSMGRSAVAPTVT